MDNRILLAGPWSRPLLGAFALGMLACQGGTPGEPARGTNPAYAQVGRGQDDSLEEELEQADAEREAHIRPRRICGFAVHTRSILDGHGTVIVACPDSPSPVGALPNLKAGIFLDPAASGSVIRNFRFEGTGASSNAPDALAFGVFSRGAENVIVENNRFDGTIQGITDAGGKGWVITGNRVRKLEVLPCPGGCGGGVGIVISHAAVGPLSADDTVAIGNRITSLPPPDGLPFAVTGILAWSVVRPVLLENGIALRGSPTIAIQYTRTAGGGVLLDAPCGQGRIIGNNVRRADTGIFVDDACSDGTIVFGNRGAPDLVFALARQSLVATAAAPSPRPLGLTE